MVRTSDTTDDGLHAVRKTARHLRVSAPVARPVVGPAAKRIGHRLEKPRRVLGEHQDTVVSRRALTELLAKAERAGQSGVAGEFLHHPGPVHRGDRGRHLRTFEENAGHRRGDLVVLAREWTAVIFS